MTAKQLSFDFGFELKPFSFTFTNKEYILQESEASNKEIITGVIGGLASFISDGSGISTKEALKKIADVCIEVSK